MTFGKPYFLLLLLAIPLLALLRGKRGHTPGFVYSSLGLMRGLEGATRSRAGAVLMTLRWLALTCFVFALAQPRLSSSETKVTASGVDIVVAMDMSGSMAAEDFSIFGRPVNRLEMAKDVLRQFIEQRPNDRIGIVAFATDAYIAAPLTLDHEFLFDNIERLQLGAIDNNRTAIGSGLSTALNRVRDLKSKSKIVILMTDGQNNSGKINPDTAAEAAQALKIKVYTIGVGTRGLARVPVYMGGQKVGYRQEQVNIDEETLTRIAKMTGGKYYRADNAERFRAIYKEIDQLEKTEADIKKYTRHEELFAWAVTPGLALLLLEVLLGHTILRRLP
jgi:Ca-activated chloride channel family protein